MENILSWLIARIPSVFSQFLTLDSDSRLGCWYYTNGIYKFPVGTEIELKSRNIVGYGTGFRGIVRRHVQREVFDRSEDAYVIETTEDKGDSSALWMKPNGVLISFGRAITKDNEIPVDVEKATTAEIHHKWNVENYFRLRTA